VTSYAAYRWYLIVSLLVTCDHVLAVLLDDRPQTMPFE